MSGLNLHALVRPIITAVHPDETILLYQSLGQENINGVITALYKDPIEVRAQVQNVSSINEAALYHRDRVDQNELARSFYLFSDEKSPVAGIIRPSERGGDFIQRDDKSWWLIIAVSEEFTKDTNWVCVRGVLQVNPPSIQIASSIQGAADV